MYEVWESETKYTPPPEFCEIADRPIENVLPEKSKSRYENVYKLYQTWCVKKEVREIESESILLAYFSELAKNKKPSSLWSTYSMLRTTLNVKNNTDISKYAKLNIYLKSQNIGYKPKKSSTFTEKDIEIFLNDAPLELLPHKVALIIGISGACRSDELFKLKTTNVDFLKNKIIVSISDTKTKQPRAFVVINEKWIAIVQQYMDLRKDNDNERFFLQVRLGKITKQPLGHNSVAQIPRKIATYLNLKSPDTYTGHCFRRTAATLLTNSGANVLPKKASCVSSSIPGPSTLDSRSCSPTPAASPSIQEFNFSNEQSKHGLSIIVIAHDNANVTININNNN